MYFLEDVYRPRSFKQDRVFEKHLAEWRKIAPDFSTLHDMAETIKELEIVFMYDNSNNSSMYSNIKQSDGTNSFIVESHDMTLKVTLYLDDDVIDIHLKRKVGSKLESHFRFKNNSSADYIKTSRDMMLFAIIEDRIMTTFCDIIEYYYYNGPHRKIDQSLLPR